MRVWPGASGEGRGCFLAEGFSVMALVRLGGVTTPAEHA
jgi:hypothetical protein